MYEDSSGTRGRGAVIPSAVGVFRDLTELQVVPGSNEILREGPVAVRYGGRYVDAVADEWQGGKDIRKVSMPYKGNESMGSGCGRRL